METLTTNQNYLAEPDENGKPRINPAYYKNVLVDYIKRYTEENKIDTQNIKNNQMLAICLYIYENIFATNHTKAHPNDPHPKSNIPYSHYNISNMLSIYKSICLQFNCIPSLYGFSILSGIDEETVKKYVTPAEVEILKVRREMLRNALSDDRMGRIVLANNDSSFGLEYEKKNAIERETVRQGLALNDLPKLE